MKLVPAFKFHRLGIACWPIYGPIFIDKFSVPGEDRERRAEVARYFDTEEEAVEFVRAQPWPRFVMEPTTKEASGEYEDLHPLDKYAVRGSFGIAVD